MDLSGVDGRALGRDALVPGLLLLVGTMELATFGRAGWQAAVAVEALASALLVLRRRHVVFPVLAVVPTLLIPSVGPAMDDVAAPILYFVLILFTLGRWFTSRTGGAGAGVVMVATLATLTVQESGVDPTDVMFVLSLTAPPYVFGRVVRHMADQQEQIESQQRELARQAVVEERGRIARELHDVIAHSISAMVVQAAAAQDAVRTDPEQAQRLLANVAATGREALSETGRLLHVVRDDADELGLTPAPGLGDIPTVVESFRGRGVRVDSEISVGEGGVPPGVDVSAYRLVQESLTNAAKHADLGGGPVRVVLDDSSGELVIRCSSPLHLGGGTTQGGSGLGLTGMAERVAVLRGSLRHGPVGDRFEVEARLPLGEAVR